MSEKLHTVRSDHAIFRGPYPVTPTITDDVDQYTGKPIRAWKVQEKLKRPGMVSSADSFWEADDSEIISGGENMKGDHGVALVREANFFMWGPAGRPSQMTEEARRVFVNTIVYMKQFDGAKQTAWCRVPGRDRLEGALKSNSMKTESDFGNMFPKDIVKQLGTDMEKYRALYQPNIGHVYVPHGGKQFAIDADTQSIGIPNNDVRLLEKCIELLHKPAEAAKARRVLERYTRLSFPTADAWQSWLEKNRASLYFSDEYDYRFFAGPAGPAPRESDVRYVSSKIEVIEPNEAEPASTGAAIATYHYVTKDLTYSTKGSPMVLVVRLKIADDWHTYARMPEGAGQVTRIDVELPKGFRWSGDWKTPAAHDGSIPGVSEYSGDAIFTRQFYATEEAGKGRLKTKLQGTIHYQVCNVERCLPASHVPFEIPLTIF